MEVILVHDVESLGKRGDLVRVKEGYARNFLLPRGLARPNTPGNIRFVEQVRASEQARLQQEWEEAKTLANRLAALSCTLRVKVGEADKLFGSVTSQDIAASLKEEKIVVDRKKIILEEPIRSLGVFQIPVRLHPEVTATLKVWVVKE
ncbi:MAG: 50S ribosomal protein L9 [Candidatus Omnitrophica bacterium]|nr:50S ribosomal protein L9 [Candidatus Omnitrophota bacterium]